MNTVKGGGVEWLLESGFNQKYLNPYLYPSSKEFDEKEIQIIYLGWFWKDWSIINNGIYSCLNGLEIREDTVENTGDLCGIFSLDEDWVTLNQMIKYYKYGFGRVSDYCNEEIRMGRMLRNDGIKLVEKYDDACGEEYIYSFSNYIGITVDQFWEQVYKSINKELFQVGNDGVIKRRFKVGFGL